MYIRKLSLGNLNGDSCFLWGPRQTGKSTLLKTVFPNSKYYDLLLSTQYRRLIQNPAIIREELFAYSGEELAKIQPIIVDEVQKIPELLDEIHWLIENRKISFILCGSSARKLKRGHGNLLGGRALKYQLMPLVYKEIVDFDLERALNHGLIPSFYLRDNPKRLLQAYVGNYLHEEIVSEALVRNIVSFDRFLEVASLSNGDIINYQNIARECGVSAPTVKEYYQILEDTLVASFVPAFTKRPKRRVIQASKFYFFDIGVVRELTKRGVVVQGSELFGKAFEQFIFQEIYAHSAYSEQFYEIFYWRTSSGFEVDFILDDQIAIEIKSTKFINDKHLRGLRKIKEEYSFKKVIAVSLDPFLRTTNDSIEIMPWEIFLDKLWNNDII